VTADCCLICYKTTMRPALCNITRRGAVVLCRRFRTTYRSHLQGSGSPDFLIFEDGRSVGTEISCFCCSPPKINFKISAVAQSAQSCRSFVIMLPTKLKLSPNASASSLCCSPQQSTSQCFTSPAPHLHLRPQTTSVSTAFTDLQYTPPIAHHKD
jgi:hypothetical protein